MSTDTAYLFDLDGTITKEEILPRIAALVGLEDEIDALTQATINGIIPFNKSFRLRVALLREASVANVHEAIEGIELHAEVLEFIGNRRNQCFIVTGNLLEWIEPLVKRVGCKAFASRGCIEAGRVNGIESILMKSDAVADLRTSFSRIISVGDGMGDVSMFESSDLSIAFGETHDPVASLLEYADFVAFKEETLCRLLKVL